MPWATRRGCHVDRTACVWLIKRFVDPGAAFAFFGDPAEAPEGAELFDVVGARLSHRGDDCSFETFLAEYDLYDPVLGPRQTPSGAALAVFLHGRIRRQLQEHRRQIIRP